jgi:hypothetical protein
MRRKAKICFPIMWNRNTFFHLLLVLYYSNLAAKYFFYLAGDSVTIVSATMQNLNLFRSARALKYVFPKNPSTPPPQIRKWLLPKNKRLYCCFVDYLKAFDSVDRLCL